MTAWVIGDPAMVECSDGVWRRASFCRDTLHYSWVFPDNTRRRAEDSKSRPLVIVDPEDTEQVSAFIRALDLTVSRGSYGPVPAPRLRNFQTALRSLILPPEPPKPDEPTGLGAVVRVPSDRADRDTCLLVRTFHSSTPWFGDAQHRGWDQLPGPIEVVAEGVPE